MHANAVPPKPFSATVGKFVGKEKEGNFVPLLRPSKQNKQTKKPNQPKTKQKNPKLFKRKGILYFANGDEK